jgi:hypothetical protein
MRASHSPSIIVGRRKADHSPAPGTTIDASDGTFGGAVWIWWPMQDVRALGEALKAFPGKVPEAYEFYFEEAEETQNIRVRAVTSDRAGHCVLELRLATELAECWLSFLVDAAAINRLGDLFVAFSERPDIGFRWTPIDAELVAATAD